MIVDEKISIAEASNFLGIPTATLNWYRAVGKGPSYVKVGRHVYYLLPELQKYREGCIVTPKRGRK
ncbi:MAG: DNA-binding protein [Nitrospirae bacterium]|nr:DNA-binding protein [Nitrospirota bacterium]